jgi:hypothetical protein
MIYVIRYPNLGDFLKLWTFSPTTRPLKSFKIEEQSIPFLCSDLYRYKFMSPGSLPICIPMRDSTRITESPASTSFQKIWDMMSQVREVLFPSENVKQVLLMFKCS